MYNIKLEVVISNTVVVYNRYYTKLERALNAYSRYELALANGWITLSNCVTGSVIKESNCLVF